MAAAVGCRVKRLVRTAVGGYLLGDLPAGAHRLLSEDDYKNLLSR